jgi:hypothetical protein
VGALRKIFAPLLELKFYGLVILLIVYVQSGPGKWNLQPHKARFHDPGNALLQVSFMGPGTEKINHWFDTQAGKQ